MGGATSHIGALATWADWSMDDLGEDRRPALMIDIERVQTASPRYGTAEHPLERPERPFTGSE